MCARLQSVLALGSRIACGEAANTEAHIAMDGLVKDVPNAQSDKRKKDMQQGLVNSKLRCLSW